MSDSITRQLLFASTAFAIAMLSPEAHASTSCIPGFNYGAFSKECSMTFAGGAVTDSYNSTLGNYATTQTNTGGNIGTNGTAGGCVTLNGATTDINGTIDVGPGGSSSTVTTNGGATFDGAPNPNVLTSPVSLPSVIIPVVGTNQGNQNINSNTSLPPNQTYDDVRVTGGATLTLSSGSYVMDELSLTGNSIIALNITTGPVIIYIRTDLDISGGTVTNATNISTNLIFMVGPACANVKLSGGAQSSYALYAPDSDVTITGGGEIFGAVVGKTVTDVGGSKIHYDQALATVSVPQFGCVPIEVSRASPVIALISNQPAIVQGTFEVPGLQPTFQTVAQLGTWSFPYITGHMRARVASTVTTSSFSGGTVLFDTGATGSIPPATPASCADFKTTCRNVFTNTNTTNGTTYLPTVVQFNTTNAAILGPKMTSGLSGAGAFTTTQWSSIITTVLNGRLGGVDRSTVAVIEPSSVAGLGTRPKMAYFGATDGMLHAVCASETASTGPNPDQQGLCPAGSLGKEMWAFLPRVQLPLIPGNATRVDGSVRVLDVFGDFPTAQAASPVTTAVAATGRRTFRTILLFQTGFAIGTIPAAYALDVTDPARPVVLWEYATPAAPSSIDFGIGVAVGAGSTLFSNGQSKNLVVLQTNNGGTSSTCTPTPCTATPGIVATAINTETGTVNWQFTYKYVHAAELTPRNGPATDQFDSPPRGVPGGAVGVDLSSGGLGFITDYVFGDLYGNLWRVDAITGRPPTGTSSNVCTSDIGPTNPALTPGNTSFANCLPIFKFSTNKHPIGQLPAIFQRVSGGDQYVAFATGGYVEPVATTWSATDQRLIAMKIKPSVVPESETTAAVNTGNLIVNAPLTTGDRVFSQAFVIGTKLFVTADRTDVNAAAYGTGSTDTGRTYTADISNGTATNTFVIAATTAFRGAGGLANDKAGNTAYTSTGERKTTDPSGGVTVDPSATAKMTRRLWLRDV